MKKIIDWVAKVATKGAGEISGEATGQLLGRMMYDKVTGWHHERTEKGRKARASLAMAFVNLASGGYGLPHFKAIYDRSRQMPGLPTASGYLTEDKLTEILEALGGENLEAFIVGLETLGADEAITLAEAQADAKKFQLRYMEQLRVVEMLHQNHLQQNWETASYWLSQRRQQVAEMAADVKKAAEEKRAGVEAEVAEKDWPAIAKRHELAAKKELDDYLASRKRI